MRRRGLGDDFVKIGLLGGTFDPVHFGHLNLAFELMERYSLDKVWFIPAKLNPLKTHAPLFSEEERLEMVKLAIEGIPQFEVKDLELRRTQTPSYTIETIRELVSEKHQLYLLLGEDTLKGFSKWHCVEEIVEKVPLLIGSRTGTLQGDEQYNPLIRRAIEKGMTKTPLFDLSSTEIRERLSKGLYCGHLVPAKVLNFLKRKSYD